MSLYILVDESKTANLADRDGTIRFSMLNTIIEFAVGYGWLADAPPDIHIFRYRDGLDDPTTDLQDFTQAVWPTDKSSKHVALITTTLTTTNLTSLINEVRPSILHDYSAGSMLREHLPTTFKYIAGLAGANGNKQNTIVILITQGELQEENATGTNIDDYLRDAKDAWLPSGINIGIFKFDSLHQENWKKQFLIALAEDPEIYLHTCCDRNIWNGMIKIYQDKGFLSKGENLDVVSLGHIGNGSDYYTFPSSLENLRVLSLDINEGVMINGNQGNYVEDLRWWDLEYPPESLVASLYSPLSSIQFLYTCKQVLVTSAPPTVTPESSGCPPNTSCPIVIRPGNFLSILLIIIVVVIAFLFSNYAYPWLVIARFLFIFDIFTLIYALWPALFLDVIEEILANFVVRVVSTIIFGISFLILSGFRSRNGDTVNIELTNFDHLETISKPFERI
jgi:hypothetical protein